MMGDDRLADGVIFDMDGVLVASGRAHAESWRIAARRSGKEVSSDLFSRVFGMRSAEIIKIIWGDDLSPEDIKHHDDVKEDAYRDLIRGMVPLTVGVRECLTSLQQAGFKLAVGTSGPPENLELVLAEGMLFDFFSATVNGFEIERGKPNPDVFLLAAERLGVPANRCVVVEDAPVGFEAAKAAGMPVIGLVGTHPREKLDEDGVDWVAERLAAITPECVQGLLDRN